MKFSSTLPLLLIWYGVTTAQTRWQPDSTGYHYLSRGTNLSQWMASPGTNVVVDRTSFMTAGGAIKWTIPPNSGVATLELRLIDIDLSERVIYTTCRRNNHPQIIDANLIISSGKGFRLPEPVDFNATGKHLAVDAWHRQGRSSHVAAFGGAAASDLRHVSSIRFKTQNAGVEQILWIDEIKYAKPRGPACIIHFNHYRQTADSLLTPWLTAHGYPANIDFTYEWARDQKQENRNKGGLWTRYLDLDRIAVLVKQYNWSTTHHGVFYKLLTTIPQERRMQLYALEPFQHAGFEAQWCFSIPIDDVDPEIYAEIQALLRFYSVRRQGIQAPNELPIDNPLQLRFYRPTSAGAGPNLGGVPETLLQMRARVDAAFKRKGLLIFDFGGIVTAPSPDYTDSEITLLDDAQALIQYADSLGFTFITFKDLFAPDPGYKQELSINHDYPQARAGRQDTLRLLQNDLAPINSDLLMARVSTPQHGQVVIASDRRNVEYVSPPDFAGTDRFYYVATNGTLSDSAWVFVDVVRDSAVDEPRLPQSFALYQNLPNPFYAVTVIRYELLQEAWITLNVYSITGQRVATLVNQRQFAGKYELPFSGVNLASGVYLYRLNVNGVAAKTNKMILLENKANDR